MRSNLIRQALLFFLAVSTSVFAETRVERHARLYGFSSSTSIKIPCEVDRQHTMQAYEKNSVGEALQKNPSLYDDESFVDFRKIPRDITILDERGFYVNDRPTGIYFLPARSDEFSNSFIPCRYSACRWLIETRCSVKGLSGEEFLVYWNGEGTLSYVLKKDFILLEAIK